VLVLGGMESAVEERLNTVKQLWDEGVRFDNIALLASHRPLMAEHEPAAAQAGMQTEEQMMVRELNEARQGWDAELREKRFALVTAPNHADGSRANTRDTVEAWLHTGPDPNGNILVISSQPCVAYQHEAAQSVLPDELNFTVETVGAAADPQRMKISTALDSIARQIDVGYEQIRDRTQAQERRAALAEEIYMVRPEEIRSDPARLQFRSRGDANGVTETHRQSGDYDPLLHGAPILLWEDKDGNGYVVDGHHRLDFVKQLRAKGEGPEEIPARIIRERDGYTAEDAKILGAYLNLMQEREPDLKDAARVFHEVMHENVHTDLLPSLTLKGNLPVAYAAGSLGAQAFRAVENGEVPVQIGALIAERSHCPEEQHAVMQIVKQKLAEQSPVTGSWTDRIRQENDSQIIKL
jgi:hypothetical protein